MTRQVEFNHFGKLRRRLELLLLRFTFAWLQVRGGRWRTFTEGNILRGSRRYLGLHHARFRLASGDSQTLSENLLRQSEFVATTVLAGHVHISSPSLSPDDLRHSSLCNLYLFPNVDRVPRFPDRAGVQSSGRSLVLSCHRKRGCQLFASFRALYPSQRFSGHCRDRVMHRSILIVALVLSAASPCEAETGLASYYGGRGHHGEMTCAHRTRPLGTVVTVTHAGHAIRCRINDRGPFVRGRVIDVSLSAARVLGMMRSGIVRVSVE